MSFLWKYPKRHLIQCILIKPREKPCKAIGKAQGFEGCGEMTLKRTYGLCVKCLRDWRLSTPSGRAKATSQNISTRSKKRVKQEQEYKIIRAEYMKLNPLCVRCGKKATDIHHTNGRRGDRLNDTRYFVSVDRFCHGWIHANPKEAKEKGWFV